MINRSNKQKAKERLLEEHPSNKESIWKILGEDGNADFVGSHTQPDLGTYQGKYIDVVEFALEEPGFFAWGFGGDIKEVQVHPINDSIREKIKTLQTELNELEERKVEIVKQLNDLK
jgi:hypothetical protein